MIFVTVGTHHQGFDRLVRAAEELAARVDEPVIIQRGVTGVKTQLAQSVDFLTMKQMEEHVAAARVVVAQAGAGTIITVLQKAKPLVVVPRLKAWGENYTDHQLQLASQLDQDGRAVMLNEISADSLLDAIQRAQYVHALAGEADALVEALRRQLAAWQPESFSIAARLEKINRRLDKYQLLYPVLPLFALAAWLRAVFFWLQGKTKDPYQITTAYLPRSSYRQFDDTVNTDHFQEEVYQAAQRFLQENGLKSVLDVGCGSGYKLVKYFTEEDTLGLEMPASLEFLRKKYPQRHWAPSDFDHPPHRHFDLAMAVDVIEHLVDPGRLLEFFRQVDCDYILLSTPERSRLGLLSRFRPKNPYHLREWNQDEFNAFLSRYFEVVEAGVVGHHDQYVILRKS